MIEGLWYETCTGPEWSFPVVIAVIVLQRASRNLVISFCDNLASRKIQRHAWKRPHGNKHILLSLTALCKFFALCLADGCAKVWHHVERRNYVEIRNFVEIRKHVQIRDHAEVRKNVKVWQHVAVRNQVSLRQCLLPQDFLCRMLFRWSFIFDLSLGSPGNFFNFHTFVHGDVIAVTKDSLVKSTL